MPGPLHGVRIIEFAGIGPAPFCGMMLADHGAEVIRIDRAGATLDPRDPLSRSRRSLALDIKAQGAVGLIRDLCRDADGLIEGYRPGVMERLGLGPEVLQDDNPALVYGRMTGWGQDGPSARTAGHDIDYIAVSGALHTVGRSGERPIPPVNYLGDFGGGGMMLAFAMVAALLGVKMGRPGQVIDCAMTEGSALLCSMTWALHAQGRWEDRAGVNLLDGGSPVYDTYTCADGRFIAVGCLEPQFYRELRRKLGVEDDSAFDLPSDPAAWLALRARLAAIFASRPRDAWCDLLEGADACVAPVLSLAEAPRHPHNVARGSFLELGGAIQPAPAPRYSEARLETPRAASGRAGADAHAILSELGYDAGRLSALRAAGVFG